VSRIVNVGAAQLGPVARDHTRADVVERLLVLLRQAHARGCDLVVYPELALTTFFPRWPFTDQTEIDAFFERELPGPETAPLFAESARLGVGFVLGYAELTPAGEHYNTSVLVDRTGSIVHRYRKVHLPGHDEFEPWRRFQHLEKRYFDVGPEGFTVARAFDGIVGLLICNDRRWPEAYRSLGLQGVELVCIGYNTPVHNPPAPDHDRLGDFHNHLVMQAGAYQNGTWVVGVAKAGDEEGVPMIGGTCIIAPTGEIVALCTTLDDELVTAACDLDACTSYKSSVFNFARHREPWAYRRITEQKGVELPPV
jgi:predicted amidohydrolase